MRLLDSEKAALAYLAFAAALALLALILSVNAQPVAA